MLLALIEVINIFEQKNGLHSDTPRFIKWSSKQLFYNLYFLYIVYYIDSPKLREKVISYWFSTTTKGRKMIETKVQIFINIGQGGVFCNFVNLTYLNNLALLLKGGESSPLFNSFSVPLWNVKQQKYTHVTQNVAFILAWLFWSNTGEKNPSSYPT